MTGTAKRKGDKAEREACTLINQLTGRWVTRALGAGRKDDIGDIHGLPDTVVQVANYRNLDEAVRRKLPQLEQQRSNADAAYAALFCRRVGGSFVVVMTPDQWAQHWNNLV